MEYKNSDFHCRWCSQSYALLKSLHQHERRSHSDEKLYTENDSAYERLPHQEKNKWYTCNICRVRVLLKFRMSHDGSFMHLQSVASSKTYKSVSQVISSNPASLHGFVTSKGSDKTNERLIVTEKSISDDPEDPEVFEDVMENFLEGTRSPSPHSMGSNYSSEHVEEDEELSCFPWRVGRKLDHYDDPSFWTVGSVNGPYIRKNDEREAAYWDSRPPLDPTHAQGRILLFSFSPTSRAGFRGEKTASTMYAEDMKRKTKGLGAAAAAPKKGKKESGKAKKSFPTWDDLPPAERKKYEELVPQNVPYSFYRVSSVTLPPGEGDDHMLTMFQCTQYGTLQDAETAKKKAPKAKQQAVITFSFTDVMNHGYWTSPFDVEYSRADQLEPYICEGCGEDKRHKTYCDGGAFRGIGPSAAPCNWAVLCTDCRQDENLLHPENKDSWLCKRCVESPSSLLAMYGRMWPPRDSYRTGEKVDILPLGAPLLFPRIALGMHPADEYDRRQESINKPLPEVENAKRVTAECLKTMFTEMGCSKKAQNTCLQHLQRLESLGCIDLKDNVPATLRTLEKTAECEREGDIEVIWFDVGALLQGEERVALLRMNWLNKMQFMLMNADVPVGAWNFTAGEKLYFKDGERAWGGQCWNNDLWIDPGDSELPIGHQATLVFKVGGDALAANAKKTVHPVYGTILNAPEEYHTLLSDVFGQLPHAYFRRPHGLGAHERLDWAQRCAKYQLMMDAYAHLFAPFEAVAKHGAYFYLPGFEGRVLCRVVILFCVCDLEEKVYLSLNSIPYCSKCSLSPKYYGSYRPENSCCRHETRGERTVKATLKLLNRFLLERSLKKLKTVTDQRSAWLGLKRSLGVQNQMFFFGHTFKRNGIFGTFQFDRLHMLLLGIFPLILYGADVLFTKYHKRLPNLSTREDVHQFVETALALLNPMTDGIHRLRHLSVGWWTLVSWKGVDYEAFLAQLLFVFSTHDVLISEKTIRDMFADLVRSAHSVYRKLKCKRFWRESDLATLDDQVLRIKQSMVKLFNLPVDNTVETFNLAAMCRIPGSLPLQ